MNRKIIFVIVVLAAIGLSMLEGHLEKNGAIARTEEVLPTTAYDGPTVWAEVTEDSTLLVWIGKNEAIQYYTVYRKLLGEKDWQFFHRVEAVGEPGYRYRLRDGSIAPGQLYYQYKVVATTDSGDFEGVVFEKPPRTQTR